MAKIKLKEAMQEPCVPVRVDVPKTLNQAIENFQSARMKYTQAKTGKDYGGYLRKPDVIVLFMLRVKSSLEAETKRYNEMTAELSAQ